MEKADRKKGGPDQIALGAQIDESDESALEKWAQNLCRGLSTEWLADALQVDPTIDSVVSRITESISDPGLRKRIDEICRREILKTSRREKAASRDSGDPDS